MDDHVKGLSEVYKQCANHVTFINAGHPLVNQFYKCCVAAMFVPET